MNTGLVQKIKATFPQVLKTSKTEQFQQFAKAFSVNLKHESKYVTGICKEALSWPTLFMAFANNKDPYEPPHGKTNKLTVRPAKTPISQGIHPVWSETSLCAQWVAKNPVLLQADSEHSDQTGLKPRLIWVFTGHTVSLLVLSRDSSYLPAQLQDQVSFCELLHRA